MAVVISQYVSESATKLPQASSMRIDRQTDRQTTLMFSYIRHFDGFKILNFNTFLGLKKKLFLEYENFVDIFLGHHKIGLYLVVISMHFRVFSQGQGTETEKFIGLPTFQVIFFGGGCLKFLVFLGVNGRCWARAYV